MDRRDVFKLLMGGTLAPALVTSRDVSEAARPSPAHLVFRDYRLWNVRIRAEAGRFIFECVAENGPAPRVGDLVSHKGQNSPFVGRVEQVRVDVVHVTPEYGGEPYSYEKYHISGEALEFEA